MRNAQTNRPRVVEGKKVLQVAHKRKSFDVTIGKNRVSVYVKMTFERNAQKQAELSVSTFGIGLSRHTLRTSSAREIEWRLQLGPLCFGVIRRFSTDNVSPYYWRR